MPLSAAEKQRRYRERRDQDPEKRANFLQKQKERYQTDKAVGKRKLVSDMTAREKRQQRKYWKVKQRDFRQRRTIEIDIINMTPPQTPIQMIDPEPSRQLKQSKRKILRETSKVYRDNGRLKIKLRTAEKKAQMYRKRWERLAESHKAHENIDTPRTKTKKLLRCYSAKVVQKTLDFHHALIAQLKENYKEKSKKLAVARLITGNVLKKYKFSEYGKNEIGVKARHWSSRYKKKGSLSTRMQLTVKKFFERDDVSRIITGQKRTVTRKKIKKQKRLLNDTVQNQYKKFIAETNEDISFTTFWRLKPFWVKRPTQNERDTCVCRICDNAQLIAEVLAKAEVLETHNLEHSMRQVVCSEGNKACMYGLCNVCKNNKVPIPTGTPDETVTWQQWNTVKEKRKIRTEIKEVTLTKKETKRGTIAELSDKFQEQIRRYNKHYFNIHNQFRHYREVKNNLKENECFIHIDFAENYVGKMSREIQSMHFGASKSQITLHTGYYMTGMSDRRVLFATISDSLQHGPAAIWAFMTPVLQDIRRNYPSIDFIHFYSDGPTTQYRQKGNFFLLTTEVFSLGFKGATWNFLEAGHGKGIPDGIGGTLKRSADRRVGYGADITNAQSFINEVKVAGTDIELFQVEELSVKEIENKLKKQDLQTVPGTMKLHQVVTRTCGEIKYRDTSCICIDNICEDHSFKDFSFNVEACVFHTKEKKDAEKNIDMDNKNKHENGKTPAKTRKTKYPSQNPPAKTETSPVPVISLQDTELVQEARKFSEIGFTRSESRNTECIATEDIFLTYLNILNRCKTFSELQTECQNFMLEPIQGRPRSILQDGLCVDDRAKKLYPDDCPRSNNPVTVRADGDCLPACGSVFAYGSDTNSNEIRVRIIAELALNVEYYLDEENLRNGLTNNVDNDSLKNAFAMYSDEFLPGVDLTDEIIEMIFKNEIMKISQPKSFMGIWQIFGLATVLQMPILSVYPALVHDKIRRHFHRIINPRVTATEYTAVIMWTSTRDDVSKSHWVPNHFVPVLPNETDTEIGQDETALGYEINVEDLKIGDEAIYYETNHNGNNVINVEIITGWDESKVEEHFGENTENKTKEKEKISETESIDKNQTSDDKKYLEQPAPEHCIENHVIVLYDNMPYPGYVQEVVSDEIFVECMRKVGRGNHTNCFTWPKSNKDRCWYHRDNILMLIPPPRLKQNSKSQYEVEPSIWKAVIAKLEDSK